MWELLNRLWRDALFLLTTGATIFAAWEIASDDAPLWVNIAAAALAGVAAGYAGNRVQTEVNGGD